MYRHWRKEVRKREGTGCSMSGARIFLRTYIRVAASETRLVYGHVVEFPFTCSVMAVFKFSNQMPLIY